MRSNVFSAVFLWLLLVAVVLPLRPLTPIDETRYATVAWEMWLRSEWVLPLLDGAPYAQKPPLLFWLMHAGWAVFGVNAWWPLMVPALASLASLLLLHGIARRLWPELPMVATWAPVLLLACGQWALFTVALYFDVLLVTFVLLGVRALLDLVDGRLLRGSVGFALAIGGGLLAKGPLVGINLLVPFLLLPWWRPGRDQRPGVPWAAWVAGAVAGLVGCAAAGAWLWAAVQRAGGDYLWEVAHAQGLGRVVNSFDHALPFWWYGPVLLAVLFPWIWTGVGWRAWTSMRRHLDEPGVRLGLAWSVSVLVILSLISGKRGHYLMGILPAMSLLLARGVAPHLAGAASRVAVLPAAAIVLVVAGVVSALPWWTARHADVPWMASVPVWFALPLLGVAVLWLWRWQRLEQQLYALAAGAVFACGYLLAGFGQFTAPAFDMEPAGRRAAQFAAAQVPVVFVGPSHGQFTFAGRLSAPLPAVSATQVDDWFAQHPQGRALVVVDRLPDSFDGEHWPYRSRWLIVVDAQRWARHDLSPKD